MREDFFQEGRAEEASELLPREFEGVPLQDMQQGVEGTPSAAYEDAPEGQAARLRPLWGHFRATISVDGTPKNSQRRKAVQMSGLLEGVRPFHGFKAPHEKTHRREALYLHALREHSILPASPSQKAHALHTQNEQTLRLFALQNFPQNQKRLGRALLVLHRLRAASEADSQNRNGIDRAADGRRENALPAGGVVEKDLGAGTFGRIGFQQALDRRRSGGVDPEFGKGGLRRLRTSSRREAEEERADFAGVDRSETVHGKVQRGTEVH